ncbi:MAG: hypothetical protein HYS89_00945, partial [Candidatus Colwellbacteria bacterium]|nr:hypothetical protein [Candidatus Colwellbacteria bacterium]
MNERNRKYFILIATLIFIFSFSVALAVEEEPETIGLTLAEKINSFYNWALAIGGIIA